jgi:PncC family amidohydrolase
MLREKELIEILIRKRLTLSTAESCTGGLLSHRLTNIPGSSKAFLCGIIAYSNASKTRILKIPPSVIQAKGAVSSETAKLMAVNARKTAGSSIGIAITGIAGPGGGTKLKPAGTVFIAISLRGKTYAQEFHFSGNRLQIKRKSADKAIDMLLTQILGLKEIR